MKVMIIPEDQTHDGFIAKPIVEALLEDLEIPSRVTVLPEPRLRGTSDALNPTVIQDIVRSNPMIELFLLIIDRDCDREGNLAKAADRETEHSDKLVACLAEQEIAVWLLALHKDEIDARWQCVRQECDPKERWAEPLLDRLGKDGPGGGRKKAMRKLSGKLESLLSLCPELDKLRERIAQFRQQGSTPP